jgi:hypothetical protein
VSYWLKSIGSVDQTLQDNWLQDRYDLLDYVRFAANKRPSGVARNDRLVLYAAGLECFYGIAIVVSAEPREDLGEKRWPWVLDVRVPLVVPRLDLAPRLSEMNVATTSVRQQSHIRLSTEQFDAAVAALVGLVS